MIENTEQVETAPASNSAEPKGQTRPRWQKGRTSLRRRAGRAKRPPRPRKCPKARKSEKKGDSARDGSKAATILELLKRPGGATSQELMKATGWQPHSVRGFLSGTIRKKMGLEVVSTKSEDGKRSYSIKA